MLSFGVIVDCEQWKWKSTPISPIFQDWKLIIRLFCIISRTLFEGESYPSAKMLSVNSIFPADWTKFFAFFLNLIAYQLGDLLNAEAIFVEELQWFYLADSCGDKELHAFTKFISQKVKGTSYLVFELFYLEAIFQHFSHDTVESSF